MLCIILAVITLLSLQVATAQEVGFTLAITNVLPNARPSGTFTFAAHPNATSGLDVQLGEREVPSLPPPAGVFIIYTVPPTSEVLWLSPKDVRTMSSDSQVRHDYDLNVTWNGGRLEVTSAMRLPRGVDSAYLVDVITDFPNNFIKARIDSGVVFTTDNPAITRMKVLVWYAPTVTSVDNEDVEHVSIAPNPSSDVLSVRGCVPGSTIHVVSTLGIEFVTVRAVDSIVVIPVYNLPLGAYIVRAINPDGGTSQQTMIRQ